MLTAEYRDFTLRERVYGSGTCLTTHSHEYSNVSVIIGGEILEAAERGEHLGRCASVVMKPAGSEHENRVGRNGARTLSIELRAASPLAGLVALRTWSWFEQPPVTRAALALRHAVERGDDIERCAHDLVDTVAGMREPDRTSPPWIAEVRRILEEHFADAARFERIARHLGLHPVYLSRAFRRHSGMSMTEYARALRLRHARHLLTSSRRSIAAVAAESGFSDSSHLSHTFAELLNMSPRRYRRLFSEV